MGGWTRRTSGWTRSSSKPDGAWALTGAGGLHAEMDNEPSIGAPWLYDFSGRPDQTQETCARR